MKVGILTFHFAHNYGAQLQAYGLSQTLLKLGHDCNVIDYRLRYIYRWQEVDTLSSYYNNQREDGFGIIKSIARTLRYFPKLKQNKNVSWDRYEDFMKNYLHLSKRVYSRQLPKLKYEAFICGSDQIWNLELTGGFTDIYFLQYHKFKKRIAYAASTGTSGFEFGHIDEITKALGQFDFISCRESALSETVAGLTGKDVKTVCDPVFLLNKVEWSKLFVPVNIDEPYILIYCFNEQGNMVLDTAKKLSLKHNMRIIRICGKLDERIPKEDNILDAGPREFLSLFNKAEIIVTNTFHGVATSIVLNKQFYVVPPSFRRERVDNILSITNLRGRYVEPDLNDEIIDYVIVNSKIDDLRRKSITFLTNSLK